MKQLAPIIFIVLFSLFLSCKKDTKIDNTPVGPSDRYKALTSHYWRITGAWYDTTDLGKAHPELMPLPTSINALPFTDSCKYYTCSEYNVDGYIYIIKGKWCGGSCTNSNLCRAKDFTWSLKNNDQTFTYDADYSIILLNDTVFRRYKYDWYNITKKLVTVYEYKPYVFK